MDELTETPSETSQPSLLNLDWLLISVSVGVLSLLPTFIALIISPAQLTPQLSGRPVAGRRRYLGPGQFFVLCVIVLVMVGGLLRRATTQSASVSSSVNESELRNTSVSIGRGLRAFVETTGERLANGDFWSAALVALPILGYAIALGLAITVLIGCVTKFRTFKGISDSPEDWDIRHSMGGALYIVGALCLWTSFLLLLRIVFPPGTIPVIVMGLLVLGLLVTPIVTMAWQIYSFAKASGVQEGSGLFFAASLLPITAIALLVAWIMIAV
ncbi:MAG: hypothetical protein AAFP97_01325 [Pseudomonadota bacterium]